MKGVIEKSERGLLRAVVDCNDHYTSDAAYALKHDNVCYAIHTYLLVHVVIYTSINERDI